MAIGNRDLGKAFQDLDISFRPAELRSGIEQAGLQRRPIVHKDVAWTKITGETVVLDITITPLETDSGDFVGTSIAFEDVTQNKLLQNELLNFNQELETAYEEVQSTNEELQTTNEELQSTVEELETTNEELQSTNEELETMNEELQAANEELETINDELRKRSNELNRANSFLESILAGLRDGVIVLDHDLHVLAWNHRSEDLWGIRREEAAGKHLLNLDIGLPLEQLRQPIRACLATKEPQSITVDAINRRGRPLNCQVTFSPLFSHAGQQAGVIVLTACNGT
ncbi:MCP methyltransferase, CheR-type with PAS/PAC sensor [Fimbriimonas ginsengisoli Gsoil 348]|uniref:MCP methyltransferase, CheR-type with PAS/PAC sensor n=1 Tax=Fimbriimonas ginsengisoli Gsoil 348 TaxID=661478 RepID=A0A068NLH6_FIMGI|nr:PAS domain-containing protein [Fimbriimonas ginsengisoli]AIE83590.1 MCP methyltransferase, CheR-type with PAS/PAC sensor [Fimbriimonas ginsengisoli Gsoil 348]